MQTQRLYLVNNTLPMLDAAVAADWPTLSALLDGASLAEQWAHFDDSLVWMRNYILAHPDETAWWHYLVLHCGDHRLIGTCGYKGGPNAEGIVEIGYEIADAYQGQGLATEAAGLLVRQAFSHPEIKAVIAHTLAEENASVGVLRKSGFQFVQEKLDPDDGPVWEWKLSRVTF